MILVNSGLLFQILNYQRPVQDYCQVYHKPHASSMLEYGWPDTLVSDNALRYNATELRQAMDDMDAHHITISSHYH